MPLDATDRLILDALSRDGRVSLRELAAVAGLSPPTVRDRIRRLEDRGVIRGFAVEIDPRAIGYTLEALIRFDPLPGRLHTVETMLREMPRVVQCDKVTGDDCFVARILLRDIAELDPLLEPFSGRARTNTAIVKASPVRLRPPPLD